MSCGACAARIERRLNRLDGVTASVNYATGRAYFASTGGREPAELIGVIESCGYSAAAPAPDRAGRSGRGPGGPRAGLAAGRLRPAGRRGHRAGHGAGRAVQRLAVGEPGAGRARWRYGGPGRCTGRPGSGLGHGAATMDTLVSMAVAASFGWSVYTLFTSGGRHVHADVVRLDVRPGRQPSAVPGRGRRGPRRGAGRPLPGGPRPGPVRAPRSPRWPGSAPRPSPCCATAPSSGSRWRPCGRASSSWCGRARRSPPTASITEGSSAVDASLVTGESTPAEVGPGDEVTGATLNMSGRLVVRATRVGADTLLAQITRLVGEAQGTKASAQRLADRIAAVFVPCVISLAVVTLGLLAGRRAAPGPRPAARPWPCWWSRARARSAWPRRRRCWPRWAAAPSWASWSRAPARWKPPGTSGSSSSTRPAR